MIECLLRGESGVPGAVHLTHAARADGRRDLVGAEFRARAEGHRFNPAVQLTTIVAGEETPSSVLVVIRRMRF